MASCFGCVIRVLAGWLQVAGAQRANRMYTHGLGEEVHVGEIGRFPHERPRGSEVSLVELRWDCVSGPVCKKHTPTSGRFALRGMHGGEIAFPLSDGFRKARCSGSRPTF